MLVTHTHLYLGLVIILGTRIGDIGQTYNLIGKWRQAELFGLKVLQ